MKQYSVFIDITVTKTFRMEAESEGQAREQALKQCRERSDYYARENDGVIDVSVSDCEEENEKPDGRTVIDKAIDYVRENLEADELAEIRAQVDRSYRYHMMPSDCVTSTDRVIELLGEYGKDYEDVSEDSAEDWWSPHLDIDDILLRL